MVRGTTLVCIGVVLALVCAPSAFAASPAWPLTESRHAAASQYNIPSSVGSGAPDGAAGDAPGGPREDGPDRGDGAERPDGPPAGNRVPASNPGPTATGRPDDGKRNGAGSLPMTGGSVVALAGAGMLLLMGGLVLRRRDQRVRATSR